MRTPDGVAKREVLVTFRITKSMEAAIERQRGMVERSEYLRRLIARDRPAPAPMDLPKRIVQVDK